MEAVLENIRDFADRAHGEQLRRYTKKRYIVHPAAVMEICRQYTDKLSVLAAALLHDVLEDTQVTKEEIRAFLHTVMSAEETEKTIKLVVELTDIFIKINYPSLNRRSRKAKETERLSNVSFEAQTIKYADLIDNSIDIAKNDKTDFAMVYLMESKSLLKKMNKGNSDLYARAVKEVDECIHSLKDDQHS